MIYLSLFLSQTGKNFKFVNVCNMAVNNQYIPKSNRSEIKYKFVRRLFPILRN